MTMRRETELFIQYGLTVLFTNQRLRHSLASVGISSATGTVLDGTCVWYVSLTIATTFFYVRFEVFTAVIMKSAVF
jgi:hypothetical protein